MKKSRLQKYVNWTESFFFNADKCVINKVGIYFQNNAKKHSELSDLE